MTLNLPRTSFFQAMAAGKRFDAALEQLGRAGVLDPSNPQVDCMIGKFFCNNATLPSVLDSPRTG